MQRLLFALIGPAWMFAALVASAADGNRLTYLDEFLDPYYPHGNFPKLITPQWVGEEGVEAVVVLAIDDMRDPAKYEAYLRPILDRLKKIDGRAPVSIMTCSIDPRSEQLQTWLKEGLSIEIHTIDHPCPCLAGGDFAKAKSTYDRCVDLMNEIPGNKPVAFRMPCCDSKNTPSPRFWAEIFNKTTERGNFLTIDSSVFNIITAKDKSLPKEITQNERGEERFRRYLPFPSFVNTIEDYPYPYVIGKLCWQFPCVVPSDWSAQHVQKPNNPDTVRDLKLALDATVLKQGVYNLVFHPHGWIRNDQIVEIIDHAVEKHGKKVMFLTFRECQERLDKNLLAGRPLRNAKGEDNGVRLLDVNNDGYLDVVIGNAAVQQTRLWEPQKGAWVEIGFPTILDPQVRFGILDGDGNASVAFRERVNHFTGIEWKEDDRLSRLPHRAINGFIGKESHDRGVRFRDIDGDGSCELISDRFVYAWKQDDHKWEVLPYELPEGASLADVNGNDMGVRFVDVNGDGRDDILFSNEGRYGLYLFASRDKGWSIRVLSGKAGESDALPLISRGSLAKDFGRESSNNGFWVHSGHLWWQNEDTTRLPDGVDRRSFAELLKPIESQARDPADKPAARPAKPTEDQSNFPKSKTPAESLATIQARPGFQVELVASEPLIADPVAFDWGPDGRLWVVEMHDYPNGLDGQGKPGGRVKVLTDTNGDGKYDKAQTFLEGIPFPTGVKVWRKGVLVTAAPDIFYAEDADGDGRAEIKRVLYTGFGEGNQQHRVNGLVWGLDNWLYVGNGDSGGSIKSLQTGKSVNISGRDLRIRPDTGELDPQSGQTQFGRCRDDWGNWFGGNNSEPLWHYVLEDHYLRRNPHLPPPPVRVNVPEKPGAAPVFPISKTLARFNDFDRANRFTSACSPHIYRDDLFGPAFAGNSFVCEPVHNLVHREILSPKGVTFTSRRAEDEQDSEFLAASDSWFRPVMARTGPDGALWVADMYRHVIEHPKWIPAEWQKKLDLRAGSDLGRIYRVYPVGNAHRGVPGNVPGGEEPERHGRRSLQPRPMPRLDKLDTAGLVAALDSPNGWQRDMAQQMLIWRQDAVAPTLLVKMIASGKAPAARAHALCALDGLGALSVTTALVALGDEDPRVRRQAVRLAEQHLKRSPKLGEALLKLVDDPDPQVRMQAAYSLGAWEDPRAGQALAELALAHSADPYLSAAVLSSVNQQNLQHVFTGVLAGSKGEPPPERLVEQLFAVAAALGDKAIVGHLVATITAPEAEKVSARQLASLAGFFDALQRRKTSLDNLLNQEQRERVDTLLAEAARVAAREESPLPERLVGVRLLASDLAGSGRLPLLARLLAPRQAVELQMAAVDALGQINDPAVPELLLAPWKSLSPTVRGRVLDALLAREEFVSSLLATIDRGDLSAAEIDARRRQQLLTYRNEALRKAAARLLESAADANRQQIVDSHQDVLTLAGDTARGKLVYAKRCANCHRLEGAGHAVGPDLAALADKSPARLLIALLDPSRAVEDRYLDYVAVTSSGVQVSGMLLAETGTSITLAGPDGKQTVVLRSELEELRGTGKSLMPEGLEKDVSKQELADLIAYVRGTSAPPKQFENNKLEVVRGAADGSIRLWAASCKVYGRTLVFEQEHRNLGYWESADDHAIWTFETPAAGRFRVLLDFACDRHNAGNTFLLSVGGQALRGKVESTGTWDNYRSKDIGVVELPAGPNDLVFRADGPIRGALIDIRSIHLVPIKQ